MDDVRGLKLKEYRFTGENQSEPIGRKSTKEFATQEKWTEPCAVEGY